MCQNEEIGIVRIQLSDEMVRKLKDVRNVSQLKKILSQLELWRRRASEGLLEKAFSRCSMARWF